jgi:hypothetical protein
MKINDFLLEFRQYMLPFRDKVYNDSELMNTDKTFAEWFDSLREFADVGTDKELEVHGPRKEVEAPIEENSGS